jgi:hypothetical protein
MNHIGTRLIFVRNANARLVTVDRVFSISCCSPMVSRFLRHETNIHLVCNPKHHAGKSHGSLGG